MSKWWSSCISSPLVGTSAIRIIPGSMRTSGAVHDDADGFGGCERSGRALLVVAKKNRQVGLGEVVADVETSLGDARRERGDLSRWEVLAVGDAKHDDDRGEVTLPFSCLAQFMKIRCWCLFAKSTGDEPCRSR